jgi:hypothetical protein
MWDALCDERTGLSFTVLLTLASAVILGPESRGTHDHILLSQIRDSPNLDIALSDTGNDCVHWLNMIGCWFAPVYHSCVWLKRQDKSEIAVSQARTQTHYLPAYKFSALSLYQPARYTALLICRLSFLCTVWSRFFLIRSWRSIKMRISSGNWEFIMFVSSVWRSYFAKEETGLSSR